jgi:hypothetical protein
MKIKVVYYYKLIIVRESGIIIFLPAIHRHTKQNRESVCAIDYEAHINILLIVKISKFMSIIALIIIIIGIIIN